LVRFEFDFNIPEESLLKSFLEEEDDDGSFEQLLLD